MGERPYQVGNVTGDRILQRQPGTDVFVDFHDGSRWTLIGDDPHFSGDEVAGYSETPNGKIICVCSGIPAADGSYHVSVMQRIDWDGIEPILMRKEI